MITYREFTYTCVLCTAEVDVRSKLDIMNNGDHYKFS